MRVPTLLLALALPAGPTAAEPPRELLPDLEGLLAQLPSFAVDFVIYEDRLPVGAAQLLVAHEGERVLVTWESERQSDRLSTVMDRTVARAVHGPDGFLIEASAELHRPLGSDLSRRWRPLGGGGTEVRVQMEGDGGDPLFAALAEAGAEVERVQGDFLVRGTLAGGGTLPDISLLAVLAGQLPPSARWEGWVLELESGAPSLAALTVLPAVDVAMDDRAASVTETVVTRPGGSWSIRHEDGRLLQILLPDGALLEPSDQDTQRSARAAIEQQARAGETAVRFLQAWRAGGWGAARRDAGFLTPREVQDLVEAVNSWSAGGWLERADVAAAVDAAQWSRDGAGLLFAIEGVQGSILRLRIVETGLGIVVTEAETSGL